MTEKHRNFSVCDVKEHIYGFVEKSSIAKRHEFDFDMIRFRANALNVHITYKL